MKSQASPNPTGREGKPITLAGYSFEDAIRKALSTPPPPSKTAKKLAKKSSRKK
jgi:hypothetical protein